MLNFGLGCSSPLMYYRYVCHNKTKNNYLCSRTWNITSCDPFNIIKDILTDVKLRALAKFSEFVLFCFVLFFAYFRSSPLRTTLLKRNEAEIILVGNKSNFNRNSRTWQFISSSLQKTKPKKKKKTRKKKVTVIYMFFNSKKEKSWWDKIFEQFSNVMNMYGYTVK